MPSSRLAEFSSCSTGQTAVFKQAPGGNTKRTYAVLIQNLLLSYMLLLGHVVVYGLKIIYENTFSLVQLAMLFLEHLYLN